MASSYTPKAIKAIAKIQDADRRRDRVRELVKAAGGKVVGMYATMTDGPGALAVTLIPLWHHHGAVVASSKQSSGQLLESCVLFTMEEVIRHPEEENMRASRLLQSAWWIRSITAVTLIANVKVGGCGIMARPFSFS